MPHSTRQPYQEPAAHNTDQQNYTPTYTVVVPAWNEAQHISTTLESLKHAQAKQRLCGNIIVVDNNCTDDTASIAANMGAEIVFEPVNQISRARNAGVAASNADFLIFLDADTQINPTLLTETLNALSTGQVVGGGSSVAFDRTLTGFVKLLVAGWNWWSVKRKAAAGCYLFCTREAFDAAGGFDEKQYAAEELVLSKALRKIAKDQSKDFIIIENAPVITSARKLDWYSRREKLYQLFWLLMPGTTRSKSKLDMWYDRSHMGDK